MTTDPELVPVAQLRELLAKATPGNWYVCIGKSITVGPIGKAVARCNYDNGPIEQANAELIAKMHNVLPALLDELDAMRALRARVEDWRANFVHVTAMRLMDNGLTHDAAHEAAESRADAAMGLLRECLPYVRSWAQNKAGGVHYEQAAPVFALAEKAQQALAGGERKDG